MGRKGRSRRPQREAMARWQTTCRDWHGEGWWREENEERDPPQEASPCFASFTGHLARSEFGDEDEREAKPPVKTSGSVTVVAPALASTCGVRAAWGDRCSRRGGCVGCS